MKTNLTITEKRKYIFPEVLQVKLDNEISLQLQSPAPPDGPNESSFNQAPGHFNNDPFKTDFS